MFNWQVYFFSTVFVGIFYFWWKRKPMRDLADKIPGPDGLPLIGIAHKFFAIEAPEFYQLLLKFKTDFHAKSFKVWMGPLLFYIPFKPEDIQILLNSEYCQDKPLFLYSELFSYGLIAMNGDEYRTHRKATSLMFVPKALKSYVPKIDAVTNKFLAEFDSMLRPEAFDLMHEAMDFVLDIILVTMFGIDHIDKDHRTKFLHDSEECAAAIAEKIFKPWYKLDNFLKLSTKTRSVFDKKNKILKFVKMLCENHEKDFRAKKVTNEKSTKFILDHVYSLRDSMTYEQTLEEVMMTVHAGFDTTGRSIAGTLLLLASSQHEQDKVLEEIRSVLSSENDEVDEQKLGQLVYLDLVIKESLRMIPQAIIHLRQPSKDIKLTDHTIPAGTNVLFLSKELQTDKDSWGEDAMEFKPERFLEENIKKVHPYAYFPFSNGPRICPGVKYAQMAMKIFLSKFLMKYRVTTDLKYEELDFEMQIVTMIKQGFTMKVERR